MTSFSCQLLIGFCLLEDACMLKGQAYPKPTLLTFKCVAIVHGVGFGQAFSKDVLAELHVQADFLSN